MLKRLSPVAAILCGLSITAFPAPLATDAPGTPTPAAAGEIVPNAKDILSTLKEIREKQSAAQKSKKTRLIQDFQNCAANPAAALDLYESAVKATQFNGESRAQTQFIEWRRKEAAHLKSRDFQSGLRLHLSYLVLTLQRGAGAEVKTLLPALLSYVQQARAEQDMGNKDNIFVLSLNDSIFVHWYQIQSWIGGIEDWEMLPSNFDGIYQKTIQPELRRLRDLRIADYWDMKIQHEAGDAAKSGHVFDAGKFEQINKPAFLWSRSEDLLSIGQKNRAVTDMFALIKGYPSHPDSLKWVARLEAILAAPGKTTGGTAATVPAQ